MCFSLYTTWAFFSRIKRWMPLCRASSSPSLCTPHPASIITSAPSPTKKSLYTRSSKPAWVTQAGMYTVSPLVPGLMWISSPGAPCFESIWMFSLDWRPAHWPSSRML